MIDKAAFEIDLGALEDACVEQPKLVWQWGDKFAEARKKAREAKIELERVEAKLDLQVREKPGKYGLDKITEGAVKAVIIGSEEQNIAQDALIQADYEVDKLKAIVDGFNDRKSELDNLVRLHGQQYFSKPTATPEIRNAVAEESRNHVMSETSPKKVRSMRG